MNDEVEFEVGPDPRNPGKEMASSLTVVAKAAPSAPPTPLALGVAWKFGTVVKGFLPVMIVVMRGNVAALDLIVKLMANGKRVSNPKATLSPDSAGTVTFVVELVKVGLPMDANQCVLMAQINGQIYSTLWEAAKAPAPTPAKPPEPPKVERLNISTDRIYTYRVTFAPGVEVNVEGVIPIQFRQHGKISWSNQPVPAEPDGTLMVEVQVTQDGARGDVFFLAAGLRSKPEYVTHVNPPVRPAPAKK